ncbi:MAG TPA: DUF2007 domain-containing protein [Geobacteraceae bacterium]
MVRFYDAKDKAELEKVEKLLKAGGIEYFLVPGNPPGIAAAQIDVAEEDLPKAEELLRQAAMGRSR